MSRNKNDSRYYGIITYPDNDELNEKLKDYNYACIFHYNDRWDEFDEIKNPEHKAGTLKEPHIHWILRFKDTKSINVLAADLGVKVGRLESLRSLRGSVRYLVHKDDPDKFQYSESEIESTFNVLTFLQEKTDDSVAINFIWDYILNSPTCTWSELMQFAIDNQMTGTLRRFSYLLNCIMKDRK